MAKKKKVPCPVCHGDKKIEGRKRGSKIKCPTCSGRGKVFQII